MEQKPIIGLKCARLVEAFFSLRRLVGVFPAWRQNDGTTTGTSCISLSSGNRLPRPYLGILNEQF